MPAYLWEDCAEINAVLPRVWRLGRDLTPVSQPLTLSYCERAGWWICRNPSVPAGSGKGMKRRFWPVNHSSAPVFYYQYVDQNVDLLELCRQRTKQFAEDYAFSSSAAMLHADRHNQLGCKFSQTWLNIGKTVLRVKNRKENEIKIGNDFNLRTTTEDVPLSWQQEVWLLWNILWGLSLILIFLVFFWL